MIVSLLRASCLALCFALCTITHAAEPLPALGASAENLTVSGLSSGGFMAVQFHVAHSALVRGAGILAGGPYYCAKGSMTRAVTSCMSPNFLMPVPKAADLRAEVDKQAAAHRIEDPAHLRNSRVWILSGGKDTTVDRAVVEQTDAFYRLWLPESAIVYERLPGAGHAMIAPQAADGGVCAVTAPPYINRCGEFDAPARLLDHLLGKPSGAGASGGEGELLSFAQRDFAGSDAGMGGLGYVYIPTGCRNGGCSIHVALHGCKQNIETIGETYVRESGYQHWAQVRRLIVLYPQTANSGKNPNGCWDWWGYTGDNYHTREAPQIKAIRAMIDRLLTKP
ncbi:MAG: poly(3-hydroxybutyrate) depolymerase [Azoarcus sp.]|jgi:poly(3-hydroxybutyrate) depolymerase|nr:poly(3-hydroxybutyrate) depolymerase [Azoarcus sp.]